jgi:hypothetical protein
MRKIYFFTTLVFLAQYCFGQNDNDVDPSNYTSFEVRKRANNGTSTKVEPNTFSSVQYIQPNSQIRLIFDEKKVLAQKDNIKIRVSATLINSKGDEKPIEVLGYVSVTKTQKTKANPSDPTMFDYTIQNKEVNAVDLQNTEVDISSEKLEDGDKIKIRIDNIKSNTGFVMLFEVDDYGVKSGPSSGFAWLKTRASKDINFQASPWLGYSFYYRPNKGASFWGKLFSPTVGPEASVIQVGSTVYVGLGGQISMLANTVKFSYGNLLGYPDKGGYFTIGLNFVNSIETLSNLVKSK